MAGGTCTGATDTDTDDPFSDRKYGPRTRSRANKELSTSPLDTQRKKRGKTGKSEPKEDSTPSHTSFAKLPPAAFPSLDPGLPAAAHEQIRRQRSIEKLTERRFNPFVTNEGLYFGSQGDLEGVEVSLAGVQKEQGKRVHFESASSCGTSQEQSSKTERLDKKRLKICLPKDFPGAAERSVSYETILTHNSVSGKLVRWHRRAKNDSTSVHPEPKNITYGKEDRAYKQEKDSVADQFSNLSLDDQSLVREYLERGFYVEMTENAAPVATSDDSTRGMPYYERLKKILKTSIKQKQDLEETLAKIEQSIWNKEAAYLDETIAGNIMKGFDNYIKASSVQGGSTSGGGTASRKKATVSEQDRLFSRSSVGFWSSMREGSPHASSTSTPSHAPTPKGLSDHPTPTSTTSTKIPSLKKKRPDEDTDGKPSNKRLKITFSRNEKD